ncbi:hypothetical protein HIM_02569 [Hirsutella minnesotensis 3608]|nr:hypothetical protein HIM_02569 [Hirsutella minnesotensis 3608]
MSQPVWLITGASSGFGLSLSLRALEAKHQVIGAVRSKTKSADAVQKIVDKGGKVVEMDMTESQSTIAAQVKEAEAIYGRIDYLVNNAGYSALDAGRPARPAGAPERVHRQPQQRGRFALEGISECLPREVAEFGILVLIVEPGPYRTNFLHAVHHPEKGLTQDYSGTVIETVFDRFAEMTGKQPGDPDKAVERMFETITGQGTAGRLQGRVLRLRPGMDAVERIERKTKQLMDDVAEARKLEEASSTAI